MQIIVKFRTEKKYVHISIIHQIYFEEYKILATKYCVAKYS